MHFFSSISFVSRANSILGVFALFVFCASFFVVSPTPLSAASFTGSIVGCGNITVSNCKTQEQPPRDGKLITGECSFCDVMDVIQKILNFLVFAVMIVATLLFCYAGVLYLFSAPSMGNIEKAHKIFWNVAIGLVITLAAWLIIDTVMKILYDDAGGSAIKQKYGPWNNILCPSRVQATCEANEEKKVLEFRLEGDDPVDQDSRIERGGILSNPIFQNTQVYTDGWAKDYIQENGMTNVKIKSGVSLNGVREETLKYLEDISKACPNCTVGVSSVTDGTHSTKGTYNHANGYKIDLGYNSSGPEFVNFYKGYLAQQNSVQDTAKLANGSSVPRSTYTNSRGDLITVLQEKDHFDIQVIPSAHNPSVKK